MVLPLHFEHHSPERLYAVDLIRHVYRQGNIIYLATGNFSRAGPYAETPFKRNVREAIDFLRVKLDSYIQDLLKNFLSKENVDGPAFGEFLMHLALDMPSDKFDKMDFLVFSTVSSSLALELFEEGILDSGNYAVEAIVKTVMNFKKLALFLDWDEFNVFTGEFTRDMRYVPPGADGGQTNDDSDGDRGQTNDDSDEDRGQTNDDSDGDQGQPNNDSDGNLGQPNNDSGGNLGQPNDDSDGNLGQSNDDSDGNLGQLNDDSDGDQGQPSEFNIARGQPSGDSEGNRGYPNDDSDEDLGQTSDSDEDLGQTSDSDIYLGQMSDSDEIWSDE